MVDKAIFPSASPEAVVEALTTNGAVPEGGVTESFAAGGKFAAYTRMSLLANPPALSCACTVTVCFSPGAIFTVVFTAEPAAEYTVVPSRITVMFEIAVPDVAEAVTCVGDVTVWPRIGVETDNSGPLTVMALVVTVAAPRLSIATAVMV